MKKIFISIITAMSILCMTSCVGDLNVESIDPNQSSTIDVDGLLAKCYATLGLTGQQGPAGMGDVADIDEGTSAFYRMIFSLNEFPADMVYWIWPDVGVDDVRNATWNSSNSLVKGLYSRLFFDVTLCNLYLDETAELAEDGIDAKRAEVRFLRALNYYYLLDLYGNVPFVVSSKDKDKPKQIMRPELFKFVEDELLLALNDLAPAGQRISYYRVDKAAAWLLLSRLYLNAPVYLAKSDAECKSYMDKAVLYSDSVINSSYELASKFQYLFMGDNDILSAVNDAHKEIILPIAQDGQHIRSYGGSTFLIAATHTSEMASWGTTDSWKCIRTRKQLVQLFFPDLKRNYEIKSFSDDAATTDFKEGDFTNYAPFMAQFEALQYVGGSDTMPILAKDDRAILSNFEVFNDTAVFASNFGKQNKSDEFKSGWMIAKFKNIYADGGESSDTNWPDMDIPFMRKAEAYLNYAEAVLRGGEQKSMSVDEAVNVLRTRANAAPLAGVTLDDILDERGREFFCEGYRRSDLVRFNKFGGNTGYNWEWKGGAQLGKDFEAYRNIYPIPNSDIITNSENLTQNEGY